MKLLISLGIMVGETGYPTEFITRLSRYYRWSIYGLAHAFGTVNWHNSGV